MYRLLVFLVTLCVHALRAVFRTRGELLIENLALRQQVFALKKERPQPVLDDVDRAFWVALRAAWPDWATRLVIVTPDTVAKWSVTIASNSHLYRLEIAAVRRGGGVAH